MTGEDPSVFCLCDISHRYTPFLADGIFFSREMGFEEMLLRKYPHAIQRYEKWIQSYGFLTVALWSCIIVVPTDLICYIAGVLRMNFGKFILAVTLGEGIICGFLIFGGGAWFRFI